MGLIHVTLVIRHQGREFRCELNRPPSDTIMSILRQAIAQCRLAADPMSCTVTCMGRPLRLDGRLTQELPGALSLGRIHLDVWTSASSKQSDIFEVDFELPAQLEESGSVVALDESDTDLEGSDFDLCLEEDATENPAEEGLLATFNDSEAELVLDEEEAADIAVAGGKTTLAPIPAAQPHAAKPRLLPPAPAPGSPLPQRGRREISRNASVRYYTRMNPQRLYPLGVIITEKSLLKVVQAHVGQAAGGPFKVPLGAKVEVEPILSGCQCYPPRAKVRIQKGDTVARFCVVPQVLGTLIEPRVVIRQDGHLLAEIPLEIKVVKQTATVIMGIAGLVLPFVAMVLKEWHLDFHSQLKDGFNLYASLGLFLLGVRPELLASIILAAAGALYLWNRPRSRDAFWDLATVTPEERYKLGQEALARGEHDKAIDLILPLVRTHPAFQPAWLFAGSCHFDLQNHDKALRCYEQAMKLGQMAQADYARAARAASRLGNNRRAYGILREAMRSLPGARAAGVLWYNLGCYAARLQRHDVAMQCLHRAVQAGYTKATSYRTDPDLTCLHARHDFKQLLSMVDNPLPIHAAACT